MTMTDNELYEKLKERFKATQEKKLRPNLYINTSHDALRETPALRKVTTASGYLLSLMETGQCPQVDEQSREKLFVLDIQNLIMSTLFPQRYCAWPRWCRLSKPNKVRQITLVTFDRMSKEDVEKPLNSSTLNKLFCGNVSHSFDVEPPFQYGYTVEKELFTIPDSFLSTSARTAAHANRSLLHPPPPRIDNKILLQKDEVPLESPKETSDVLQKPVRLIPHEDGAVSCLDILLSLEQMMAEKYPIPGNPKYHDFVTSKHEYLPVHVNSPMFGLDCEMVNTKAGNELARVTIVDQNYKVVYDTLCKPYNKVWNYLTQFSGITKKMLDPVTKRLKDVQREINEVLPGDAVLVGQSLNCDLYALKLFHPYVVDTSVIFNHSGVRNRKIGLKHLIRIYFGRLIQGDAIVGHQSDEDASAALELAIFKMTRYLEFGDAVVNIGMSVVESKKADPEKQKQKVNGKRKVFIQSDDEEEPDKKRPKFSIEDIIKSFNGPLHMGLHQNFLSFHSPPNGFNLLDLMQMSYQPVTLISSANCPDTAEWGWKSTRPGAVEHHVAPTLNTSLALAEEAALIGSRLVYLRLPWSKSSTMCKVLRKIYASQENNSLIIFLFPGSPGISSSMGTFHVVLKWQTSDEKDGMNDDFSKEESDSDENE